MPQPLQHSQTPNIPHLRAAYLPPYTRTTCSSTPLPFSPYSTGYASQDENRLTFQDLTPPSHQQSNNPYYDDYVVTPGERYSPPASYSLPMVVYGCSGPEAGSDRIATNRMSISALVSPSQGDVPAEAPNGTYTFSAMADPITSSVEVPARSEPDNRCVASAWAAHNPLQPTFPTRSRTKNTPQSTAAKTQRSLAAAQKHSLQETRDKEIEKIHADLNAAIESVASRLGM
jgi:hypothetical protein